MKKLILPILILLVLWCYPQLPKYRVVSLPVQSNGKALPLAWAGGMDSPQFSPFDIDGDGKIDLYVFDRASNKSLVFINHGGQGDTAYEYAPQFESLFPIDLNSWALLRDYNNDGIPDLFTHAPLGTTVYKGRRDNNNVLRFDLVSPLLKYSEGQFNVNIWTNVADIPVFTDINGDGDMDVLSYSIFGTSVEYYENQTKEHSGEAAYDVDSLRFERVTSCWGQFTQNSLTNGVSLHDSFCIGLQPPPNYGSNSRHTGNSIYHFDYDNDGDADLLNGNVGYSNLVFLHNCGSAQESNICEWDSLFPHCTTPVNLNGYPAAFGFDGNNDQLEDLLIAPNSFAGQGDNVMNVWHYQNTGDTLCPFTFMGDSFLVRLGLDFGSNSTPVFYDFNGDGLLDILIGNSGYYHLTGVTQSTLAYLQNTGTPTHPKFNLITSDYDSLSRFHFTGVHPAFGDLDGDGMPDMLLGEQNGFVHFFKNTGAGASTFHTMTQPQYFLMKVGNFSSPFIYDLDGDSLNDVLVGGMDGRISYYWNFGTKFNAQFDMDSVNTFFGGIDVTPYGSPFGFAAPIITKDSTGKDMLLVGNDAGEIFVYAINADSLRNGSFTLLDSNFLQTNLGANAVVSVADVNNDGLNEYVVGNGLGGLFLFSDSLWDSSTVIFNQLEEIYQAGTLRIYPNPARDYFVCVVNEGQFSHPQVQLYNIIGEEMSVETQGTSERIVIHTNNLSAGFYFIRIVDNGKSYTGKVLLK